MAALANLKKICEEHLAGRYKLQVVDLLENPQLARGDQILAIPTLVRKLPLPVRKIIGDLSNTERVLVGLDLRNMELTDLGFGLVTSRGSASGLRRNLAVDLEGVDMPEKSASKTQKQLVAENKVLRARLDESEEILRAIRSGEVDALIVSGVGGEQILTLKQVEEALRSSEEKYRTLVEEVNDGFYRLG